MVEAREQDSSGSAEVNRSDGEASVLLRKHNRYRLELPVIFSWEGVHMRRRGTGLTRDVSTVGAFVFTESLPPLEADIKLKAILPRSPSAIQPVQIYSKGRVVRVTPAAGDEARGGFAVVGKSFVWRRGEKPV